MFDFNNLLASLLWGTIGMGFFIYGKRSGVTSALVGGLAIIAVSYFVGSPLVMSLVSVGLIAGTVGLIRHGY